MRLKINQELIINLTKLFELNGTVPKYDMQISNDVTYHKNSKIKYFDYSNGQVFNNDILIIKELLPDKFGVELPNNEIQYFDYSLIGNVFSIVNDRRKQNEIIL